MTPPLSYWSFLRDALEKGSRINDIHKHLSYEVYSARMDAAARELEQKLIAELAPVWSKTLPTVPGCYWVRSENFTARPCRIWDLDGELQFECGAWFGTLKYHHYEFAGPLPEAVEPKS